MTVYELRFKASVAKDLRGIPKADVAKILAKARSLSTDPRPPGSQKLAGDERYRIRQGDYRILYSIFDALVVVEVVKIVHRKEVYRDR
ncbi:MAG: type II toxin-antitoxin system RelE family toxin [Stenotrophobium sp.]